MSTYEFYEDSFLYNSANVGKCIKNTPISIWYLSVASYKSTSLFTDAIEGIFEALTSCREFL